MKEYERLFTDYNLYILGMQEILNDADWKDNLNDIAELIFLSYMVRKKLENIAPKISLPKLEKWDKALLTTMDEIKKKHKPAYEYFLKVWKDLLPIISHPSPSTAANSAIKS